MMSHADRKPTDPPAKAEGPSRRGPRIGPALAIVLSCGLSPIALAGEGVATRPALVADSGVARLGWIGGPPLAIAAAAMGLFALAGRRLGRVRDPEALAERIGLELLGTIPTLPKARREPGRCAALGAPQSRRDLEGFLDSLDRLRSAIHPGQSGRGRGTRTLLIAGPRGGEGRSTLAAQLAERCAHAGLLTLLIDADLRRPTLGRMLELPEGRGLVDILLGEAGPEEVISAVGGRCGFHALPAGTVTVEPDRLLQGDRLPNLLARARASFDLVIVDAPAVLEFPDALTIGRSVDAALLAARSRASRPEEVERACRRLIAAGVPVLGLAVNGVRASGPGRGGRRPEGPAPGIAGSR